jgi:predicted RNase H-like HicB family nuclease
MDMKAKILSQNLTLSIVVEKDKDGYVAECRELQGCYATGETYEEAMKNIKEVIKLHLEDRVARGDLAIKDLSQDNVSLTTLSFALPCHVA